MLQMVWKLLKPKAGVKEAAKETVNIPVAPSVPVKDPVAHPSTSLPCTHELLQSRARDPELGIAVAAKVASWRLHVQMGTPHIIPADYRSYIFSAMESNDFELQSMLYCLVQINLIQNYPSVASVKAL
ncbi:hypothetical protein QE369_000749 [Agrobacterium larrymoorei]|uniref:Uncharacterized protein n=1 Tax=Agrobacterium larrymoorei TaxID=160699 RepID=A0AAJ2EQ16_9HYPH|nr:hypothetical protein [Agrobacterium larrymoorei]MDR6100571.1 hypothetical protein [Agrobacterium larrymoorei]